VVTFSENALAEISSLMAAQEEPGLALRLAVLGRGPGGFRYDMAFVKQESRHEEDRVVDLEAFQLFVDPVSAGKLEGASVDYIDQDGRRGFKIDNPNAAWKDPLAARIQQVLDEHINPGIALHGGFVILEDVRDGVAYVTMGGGCQGCGMARITLKDGVEAQLLQAVPEIKEVVDLTDHAHGSNPYYR
jgi:Fe/S biogenesis protein NfuA